jgi:hypothetical protein
MRKHPIYTTWNRMLQRCSNPNNEGFRNYGGRGIRVCERWRVFANFCDDMLPTWRPGLTIHRTDNNGNYEPGNCCWATPKVQGRSKRTGRFLDDTPWGRITLAEAAELSGIHKGLLWKRLRKQFPPERLFQAPMKRVDQQVEPARPAPLPLPRRVTVRPPPVTPKFGPMRVWCAHSGVGRAKSYEMLAAEQLRGFKNGRTLLIDIEAGLAYLRTLPPAKIRPRNKPRRRDTTAALAARTAAPEPATTTRLPPARSASEKAPPRLRDTSAPRS